MCHLHGKPLQPAWREKSAALELRRVATDISRMLRVLGIPAVLVTLFVGAYLSTQDMRSNGSTSPTGRQEIAQAQSATAGVNFSQVVPALQAYFAENRTYV